mmetsp:Transcript_94597/g.276469  ORF Transcript_94597/g.276469 Transcript_94597/m.276469 type:complete len:291 (-) Transcript_94597:181-1053(-)
MAARALGVVGSVLALFLGSIALPVATSEVGLRPTEVATQLPHHVVLLRRSTGELNEIVPGIKAALSKATSAAKLAWAITSSVKKQTEENLKLAPLVEAEIANVQKAAETAKEQDDRATALFNETRAAVEEAAMEAAQDYYMKVKLAGAHARTKMEAFRGTVERRAAKAADDASKPYSSALVRAKKVMVEYSKHAQALAAAAITLQADSANETAAASEYQRLGQVPQAEHLMRRAGALFHQAELMKERAEQMRAKALQVQEGLPAYHEAERLAAESAADAVRALASAPSLY